MAKVKKNQPIDGDSLYWQTMERRGLQFIFEMAVDDNSRPSDFFLEQLINHPMTFWRYRWAAMPLPVRVLFARLLQREHYGDVRNFDGFTLSAKEYISGKTAAMARRLLQLRHAHMATAA